MNKEQLKKSVKLTKLDYELIKALNDIGSSTIKKELFGAIKRSPLGEYGGLQDLVTYMLNNKETELDMPVISNEVKKGILKCIELEGETNGK